ncbi:hypothetical protein ACFOWM_10305 [Ferruginibacter yonginensis]|uniref:DUF4105 domain-containing protein n=1 Tax=Ferruginibacter yonginensis TaxID=1310416 RepID=A0ABV8QSI7_9BACT
MKKYFIYAFLVLSCFFYSCKKIDFDNIQSENYHESFFYNPKPTSESIKLIISRLETYDSKVKFTKTLSKYAGKPIWDKVSILKANKSNSQSLIEDNNDSIIVVPLSNDNKVLSTLLMFKIEENTFDFSSYNQQLLYDLAHNFSNNIETKNLLNLFFYMENKCFGTKIFYNIPAQIFPDVNNLSSDSFKIIKLVNTSSQLNLVQISQLCYEVGWVTGDGTPYNGSIEYPSQVIYLITNCIPIYGEIEIPGGNGSTGGGAGTTGTGNGGTSSGGGGGSNSSTDCGFLKWYTQNPCDIYPHNAPHDQSPDIIDVYSDESLPTYPDISDDELPVSLQSLFNCFNQIPNAGATYSVKLCVDLPVDGMWNAPFNLTQKSPGHTFLTLTKTNGSQSISQSVGFYPIGSGGTPINPNATGGFKNNGDPNHEYNAALNAYNVSATQFSNVLNNLLSHENDTYNIYDNNCTTIAINAFNLVIASPIVLAPFVVQTPFSPVPVYFLQSPQKLYQAIRNISVGTGISKQFNVDVKAPLSTNICP